MTHSQALVVFVKAPVAGRCKTRLVPPLSPAEAATLYKAFCCDIVDTVCALPRTDVWIAYQPHADFPTPHWLTEYASLAYAGYFNQEGLDLGARLIHAFQSLFDRGYKSVCVIGSDAPSLPRRLIEEAFDIGLKTNAAVFGPAKDGGYYLTGLSQFLPELFQGIPWSSGEVLQKTAAAAKKNNIRTYLLDPHYDVDNFEDLKNFAQDAAGAPTDEFISTSSRRALKALNLL
jgi:rSAM/selenodomain-associated transferase 1